MGGASAPARIARSAASSASASSGCVMEAKERPSSSSRECPVIAQNARFTWRKTPSSVTTQRPTAVRSNASRARSSPAGGPSRATALTRLAQRAHALGGGPRGGAPEGGPEARAEAARDRFEHAVLGRVFHELLGLDHVARHRLGASEAVGEPELDALLPGPDEPGEHVGRLLQALPAALAHDVDELLVDLLDHLLRVLLLRGDL